jgi:molybdopterin adenylyltransferase
VFTAGIITASDKCYAGKRDDLSGKVIKDLLREAGYRIERYAVLPDDVKLLKQEMIYMSDSLELNLIVTTGGTGFAPRDLTPEATKEVIERETPGISEAMRYMSLSVTPKAMLSRGISGIRGKSLIINLPGSPKAVRETLNYIIEPLEHGLNILLKKETECAR